jgi:diketogulonate reductase-like aldo/keto reductase
MPLSRRQFLASVAAVAPWSVLRAQPAASRSNAIITKRAAKLPMPLPAIGLGTFVTFDVLPGEPRNHLKEVIQRFWTSGGRLIDTSPLYGMGEIVVGDMATSLGIAEQLFIANKIWSTGEFLGDDSHARRSLEGSLQRLWRHRIDLMQCHSLVNVDVIVPLLKQWKSQGRIGFVGATHHELAYFSALAEWVEKGDLDVVQVHYSIHTRAAEQRILPAAAAQGVAVFVNMPLEKARLHKLVAGQALPKFAEDAGMRTWSEYFLKWVISHPAVTCAIPATSNPAHAEENMRALQGSLLDPDMRERMYRHMQSVRGFAELDRMPWYPDKQYRGAIHRAQQALRGKS